MKRLHVIGRKNHGKTTLVVDLVKEFARRGIQVGTIKHTHHHHELDVPGKDSYRHREAGAAAVGILSPSMSAIFLPAHDKPDADRYAVFSSMFVDYRLLLVEGDSQTEAAKIEIWRKELGTPPIAGDDKAVLAVVTDDPISLPSEVLPRCDIVRLADWIVTRVLGDDVDPR